MNNKELWVEVGKTVWWFIMVIPALLLLFAVAALADVVEKWVNTNSVCRLYRVIIPFPGWMKRDMRRYVDRNRGK